jgi:AcrR family transcriptional regulator
MVRAGLSTNAVVQAALVIIDERGLDALTLAAVAAQTGVATPSLYKHVGSLAELRSLVRVRLMQDMTEHFTNAVLGLSGTEAIAALMHAYRAFVRQYPARYACMPADPLGDPALAEAGGRLMSVLLATLRGFGLEGTEAIHAARGLRVVVHGFADIEAKGGFGLPEDFDESYERLIRMYLSTLPYPS